MSGRETRPAQSLQGNPAREQKDHEANGVSPAPGFADVADVLCALAETGEPAALPKLSITDQGLCDLSRYLVEHDPSSQLFVPLAEEFCSRKLWSEAAETCRRGLAFHPRQFRMRVLLGWALWEQGHSREAEALLAEVRKELEQSAVIYKILAGAAENRGDSAQAWQLMHIYQSLHQGEPQPTVGSADQAATRSSEATTDRGPRLPQILAALLHHYETTPLPAVPPTPIFSAADRLLLADILRACKP